MTPIDSIVARLTALHPKRIDLSLERVQRLLAALDHPERKLPPVIHVAGTNGKGSTIAFLRAILEASGQRVHAYTSPHLVRFNERFRLGVEGEGRLVSDDELAAAMEECERVNGGAPITVFEITTAVALLLFARHPADVLLMEVGLGGRLDATNVIDDPLATIITPISIDHTDFLGDTLAAIAAEKAGILKRGVPAIVAAQKPRRARRARTASGETQRAAQDCRRGLDRDRRARAPGLSGRGGSARSAGAETLRPPPVRECRPRHRGAAGGIPQFKIAPAAYEAGMVKADWPARLHRLAQGRLVGLVPAGSELWLDGGHNPDGGRAIAAALADLEERVSRPLVLIVGMLASKDCEGFLRNFTGLARRMIAVPVPGADKGLSAEAVADAARAIGLSATSRDNLDRGARRHAQARSRSAAAHSDHRLALSCGRSLARERHAAGLKRKLSRRSGRAADPLMQLLLRRRADLARGDLAVLEQQQRRDRHDAVFGGGVRVLVDIELDDLDLVAELAGDLFQRRRDHAAGAAPFRPEIHHDRFGRFQNIRFEACVRRFADGHGKFLL